MPPLCSGIRASRPGAPGPKWHGRKSVRTSSSQAKRVRRRSRLLIPALLAAAVSLVGPGESRAERPFPGPNGAILYGSGGQIFRVNPDGTGNVALTPSGPGDSGPAWSPDGTHIAFDRCLASGGCYAHIWVMNADGSGAHAITSGYNDFNAVWSPDGTRIAYTASGDVGNNWFELRMMNADGSGNHRLAGSYDEHVIRIASVTFSPGGRKILFERQTNITGGTWVIGSNGKDAHVVPNVLARPSWGHRTEHRSSPTEA